MAGTGTGYMIPVHNHNQSSVSAVFYILCEEFDKGGELELIDPKTNSNRGYDKNFSN